MKILLIHPFRENSWDSKALMPPLSLATIAALTPEDCQIKIIDEAIPKIDFDREAECADLVGISCMTASINAGYYAAKRFRDKGVPVVIGGIHPSMLPEEAKIYSDSVIIGEAESVWKDVVQDCKDKKLKDFYYGERLPLDGMPLPRRELYRKKYMVESVQTARGCPSNCEFCSVSEFNGRIYRQRPVDEVVTEISGIRNKTILFVDDNIIGYGEAAKKRAIELFTKMAPLKKRWAAQASINIADDDDVLKAAAEAGCQGFFIGMESINEKNLQQMNKTFNLKVGVKNYKDVVKKIHNHGILVHGAFVFGNDFDTKSVFKETVNFVYKSDIDTTQYSVLIPLPGTRLYKRVKSEGRLLHTNYPLDWDKVHETPLFTPKNMSPEELWKGVLYAYDQTHSIGGSFKRMLKSFKSTKSVYGSMYSFVYNRMSKPK